MSNQTPILRTRREFLQTGVGLAATSLTVPAWLHRTAFAIEKPFDAAPVQRSTDRIVVVVQFSGGNDGLNTVVPYSNDAYHKARPEIGLHGDQVLKLNDELGLHPKLAAFKNLYDHGEAAVVLGVGYPNPNRSHFRSMEIWHTASDSSRFEKYGWIGRYFDNECKGDTSPASGVSISVEAPQSFTNTSGRGICFADPNAFKWTPTSGGNAAAAEAEMKAFKAVNGGVAPGNVDFLTRTALNAQLTSDRVRTIATSYKPNVTYPANALASNLKLIAGMISGGLGSKIYYCQIGGFDTHTDQLTRHGNLMETYADTVAAFHHDLKAQGNSERVLIMSFSEFGRRVTQNASSGTDHGVAGPMLLVGGGVKAGLYGKYPSLTELDSGDLKANVDFRQVYATILDKWLKTKSESLLGQKFEHLGFI